ncbi:MAG: RluA family pseudouridine synthase [Acidobacteriota bacterium]
MTRFELTVTENERRMRLEDLLFGRFGGLSKMYIRQAVKDGSCEVNGRHENVGARLSPGDFIEIELDIGRENAMRAEAIPLNVIFEDAEIIVIDKPAGMLVHPSHRDKTGTLLNALTFHLNEHLQEGRVIRPGLVHRLDKQTSGLMVVAKNARSHRILAAHFRKKLIKKLYLARAEGIVGPDAGVIEAAIGRFPELKQWGVQAEGKMSETRFNVITRDGETTLLRLEPITGRTNQLRIHCQHLGHPIVGDVARGGREFERLCLHAEYLAFFHPNGGEFLEFRSTPSGFPNGL